MVDVEDPFADVDDLKARWPDMPMGAEDYAAILLLDASQFIVDAIPSAVSAPELTLKRVTCAVVRRSMQAPEDLVGIQSSNLQAGPFATSRTPVNPHGDFYLTSQEKSALGFGKQVAYEVDMLGGGVK